jgi:hypothetical protein
MTPNTVIMGWGEESEQPAEFTRLVRSLLALDHNLLFVEHDETCSFGKHETIDIWWGGLGGNGELMLLLAYLITSSDTWTRAKVRINVIIDAKEKLRRAEDSLNRVLKDSRVRAKPNVIMKKSEAQTIPDCIAEVSHGIDLVIMGLRDPYADETDSYVAHISSLIERLGTVLLVRSSSRFQGASLLFDEE